MRRVVLTFLILFWVAQVCFAQKVEVEKFSVEKDVTAGNSVTLGLRITNPFNDSLPVKIKDKNVFAGNGLDIQCYELNLPAGAVSELRYDPIQAFVPGEYQTDPAEVSYINPASSKEENVKSNPLKIEVKESKTPVAGQQQGITTVYQCGNTQIRSTQYSSSGSGSSVQINIGGGGASMMQQVDKELQDMFKPKSVQERLSEMQQRASQNMQGLRQQMAGDVQKQNEMKEALKQEIAKQPDFKKLDEELKNKGFTPAGEQIDPASNKTGDFNFQYQRQDGQSAQISGSMEDGKLKNISKWSSEEEQIMRDMIEKNPDFQKAQQEIMDKSFIPQEKNLGEIKENASSFVYEYKNINGTQANITGRINTNGSIENLKVLEEKKDEKKKSILPWLILLLLLLAALLYVLSKRKKKVPEKLLPPEPAEKEDVLANALALIFEAEQLYREGQKKEAYSRVSEALRYFFRKKLNLSEDLTDSELSRELVKRKHVRSSEFSKCLSLCGFVKFAKYTPNDGDFSQIIKLAKKSIR